MKQDEPPEGWTWGIGEVGNSYYDYWAYHDEWELHLFWDKGSSHVVELLKYNPELPEDQQVSEYATKTVRCSSEEEAELEALRLMEEYQ